MSHELHSRLSGGVHGCLLTPSIPCGVNNVVSQFVVLEGNLVAFQRRWAIHTVWSQAEARSAGVQEENYVSYLAETLPNRLYFDLNIRRPQVSQRCAPVPVLAGHPTYRHAWGGTEAMVTCPGTWLHPILAPRTCVAAQHRLSCSTGSICDFCGAPSLLHLDTSRHLASRRKEGKTNQSKSVCVCLVWLQRFFTKTVLTNHDGCCAGNQVEAKSKCRLSSRISC